MTCPCGCGASEEGHCWKESYDSPCDICQVVPCYYFLYGKFTLCSPEHVREMIARQNESAKETSP